MGRYKSRVLGTNQIKWAAAMWRKGYGTAAIARNLRVPEPRVYNSLEFIRQRIAYDLRSA